MKNKKINKTSRFLIDGKTYANGIYDIHVKNRDNGIFLELLVRKLFPFVSQKYRMYDCGASSGTTINVDAKGNFGTCKSFLCLKTKYVKDDIRKILNDFKRRSPIYNRYCLNCMAQGICGNGCAYEAEIYDKKKVIDKRACDYVTELYKRFIIDLWDTNKSKTRKVISEKGYYIPTRADRKKILGSVRKNFSSLKQCIGHEI